MVRSIELEILLDSSRTHARVDYITHGFVEICHNVTVFNIEKDADDPEMSKTVTVDIASVPYGLSRISEHLNLMEGKFKAKILTDSQVILTGRLRLE